MNNYLSNYNRKCKDTVGKLKRLYITTFKENSEFDVEVRNGELFQFPNTHVYLFDIEGEYNQNATYNNGLQQWSQDVSFQLSKMYGDLNPEIFTNTKFTIIGETNNNTFLLFGINGGLEAEVSNPSGSNKSDFNGFSIDMRGLEEQAAILTTMDFFLIDDGKSGFNYDFNFNL